MNGFRNVLIGLLFGGATASALASEGGGSGPALLNPDYGTIFWTVVTFVLLAVMLGRFAWKPLLGAIDVRQKSIEDSIDQARANREEAERLLQQQHELLTEARRERAEAVEQGQRDAEKVKAEILEEARAQSEQLKEQTQAQLAAGLDQARSELRASAADLAILAAEKLLSKNLDDATQRKLVEDYLTELGRSSKGNQSLPS